MAKQRQDNYDLAVMLLDTGCRLGEIAKLSWMMVDVIDWKWITIHRTKVDNQGQLAVTNRMREVLQRRHGERHNGPYVFPSWSEDGEKQCRTSTAAIRRAMHKIGINSPENVALFGKRDVRSLRDTYATKVVKTIGLYGVQRQLGHASPAMSQKYAFLVGAEVSQDAAAMLDAMTGATP